MKIIVNTSLSNSTDVKIGAIISAHSHSTTNTSIPSEVRDGRDVIVDLINKSQTESAVAIETEVSFQTADATKSLLIRKFSAITLATTSTDTDGLALCASCD